MVDRLSREELDEIRRAAEGRIIKPVDGFFTLPPEVIELMQRMAEELGIPEDEELPVMRKHDHY